MALYHTNSSDEVKGFTKPIEMAFGSASFDSMVDFYKRRSPVEVKTVKDDQKVNLSYTPTVSKKITELSEIEKSILGLYLE